MTVGVEKLFQLLQQLGTFHTVILRTADANEGAKVAEAGGGQYGVDDDVADLLEDLS